MPKLPVLKPKQLITKLEKLGFVKDHTTGSHIVMFQIKTNRRAVVPMHLKDIPKGTLSAILRESGVTRDEILK